jgi:trigger factor
LETQFTTLEGCKRELTVKLTASELEPHYEKAYIAAQPELQVQGFRKGKVPLNIIKKRFGKTIEADAIESIASEVFNNVVHDSDISPVGQPAIKDIQRESDGSLGLTIVYEVLPDFDLQPYRNIEIEKVIYTVRDEDVDREIERLTMERAELNDAEQVEDDMYFVTVRLNPIDTATGMPLIGGQSNEIRVFIKNEPVGSELKTALLNTKVGDSFRYNAPSNQNGEANAETVATTPMMATVQEIKHVVPAEFTNEFVELLTQGQFTTTEDLRQDFEKQIRTTLDRNIKESMTNQLVDKILKAHDFEPPQSLVSEVVSSMLQEDVQRLPDKKLPKGFDMRRYVERASPVAFNTAKWMIIRERIVEAENIEVSQNDIERHIEELATMLNMESTNMEYLRSAVAGDENVKNRLLSEKVIETLLDYAIISEREHKPDNLGEIVS